MSSVSNVWSCRTVADGFAQVRDDVMDPLEDQSEEMELQREIEARGLITCSKFGSPVRAFGFKFNINIMLASGVGKAAAGSGRCQGTLLVLNAPLIPQIVGYRVCRCLHPVLRRLRPLPHQMLFPHPENVV